MNCVVGHQGSPLRDRPCRTTAATSNVCHPTTVHGSGCGFSGSMVLEKSFNLVLRRAFTILLQNLHGQRTWPT